MDSTGAKSQKADPDSDVGFKKLSVGSLQNVHRDIATRAIRNVLSSQIAETTYAQIIDGLPLASVARDGQRGTVCVGHPLLEQHEELSQDVISRAQELRIGFNADTLEFDSRLIYTFQAAGPGSRAFQTRLIELVAIAIHQVAAWLFKSEPGRPEGDELASWRPTEALKERYYLDGYPPTLFLHEWYRNLDKYPEGTADGVGYWAESRILGGVVLFDRRDPGLAPDVDHNAVYLHPDRLNVTYRIFELLPSQKKELIQFLLSEETPPKTCPLPILGDLNNRHRIDPEEPIEETGIYRDNWERLPPNPERGDRRLKDVIDIFNYVTQNEWQAAKRRARRARARWYDSMLGEPEEKP